MSILEAARIPRRIRPTAAAAILVTLSACSGTNPVGPYSPRDADARDSTRAQILTNAAVAAADLDAASSEQLLRDALTADLYFGPAHNNLGVLFFRQGKLYEAANEFEWARKLMPGHPDPRLNLALVLERAGHTAEAFTAYESALEVAPEHVPTMQAYARLAVREGRNDEKVDSLMRSVALRGETETWRVWAQEQLARRP